jgi:hypothetical protein
VKESEFPNSGSNLPHSIANILKNKLPDSASTQTCTKRIINANNPPARKATYIREQCIIVKGIPEVPELTPKEQVKNDIKHIQDNILAILHEDEIVQILKVFRIGIKNNINYSRPVKIILENSSQVKLLLERRGLLRTINPDIYFQKDYHPLERQKFRDLYSELKSRREKGETDIEIRNGVIVNFQRPYLWQHPIVITRTSQ